LGNKRFSLVDEADFDRVNAFMWSDDGRAGQHIFYERTKGGSRKSKRIRLHHFILGVWNSAVVDHINGDESDNRRANLRQANHAESAQNRGKRARRGGQAPRSKYKGVWQHTLKDGVVKYSAVISVNKKRKYLGFFETEQEAAEAYDTAARELHGHFACVNFPQPGERGAVR